MSDIKGWTIAYRKRTANRFLRVTNWQGSWAQALAMAALFSAENPDLQVWYVPTAEFELQGGDPADIGNVMIDSGKRIKIREGGELPAEMIARIPSPRVAQQRWIDGVEIAEPAPAAMTEDEAHAEALAIAASIRIDGRPADVTALLNEAELKTDAIENLVLVRQAHALLQQGVASPDRLQPLGRSLRLHTEDARGLHLGIGHVAPATIERARAEALVEQQARAWWKRHGLDLFTIITAADILAARDADHAEALHEQIGRNEVARVKQYRSWLDRHGLRAAPAATRRAAVEADHDEALLEYAVRLVRP